MELPAHVFFDCKPERFDVVGYQEARELLSRDSQPWMSFVKGPGNVFESSPARVLHHQGGIVEVACDGCTVTLDFEEGRAYKTTREGRFAYMGGLEEGNEGRGWIPYE